MRTGIGIEVDLLKPEAQLRQARTEFELRREDLGLLGERTGGEILVRALMNGSVLRCHALVGAAVEPGAMLVRPGGESSALWVVANVFENDLLLVGREWR